jgi:hypothetical protein
VITCHEARRALRHTCEPRPILLSPDGVEVFDELIANVEQTTVRLVPDSTREALNHATPRRTLTAYVEADLSVAAAAKALTLHPTRCATGCGKSTASPVEIRATSPNYSSS